jgi:hypothetical protein
MDALPILLELYTCHQHHKYFPSFSIGIVPDIVSYWQSNCSVAAMQKLYVSKVESTQSRLTKSQLETGTTGIATMDSNQTWSCHPCLLAASVDYQAKKLC